MTPPSVSKKPLSRLRMLTCVCSALIIACALPDAPGRQASTDKPSSPITFPKIDRRPRFTRIPAKQFTSIPKYDPESEDSFQVDLRSADLWKLDLRESAENLFYATFDDRTAWPPPDRMPRDFDPKAVMELGKNPGLGVRSLHARGITGKGVGIAIVDQPLVTNHIEYAARLRLYEEVNIPPETSSAMHGAAVASIAVGKTVGVAPDADLYFIAAPAVDPGSQVRDRKKMRRDFTWYAEAVRRIIEINKQLPANEKIRAISLSIGWSPTETAYSEMTAAANAARDAGLLVTSSSIEQTHKFRIHGLGRAPMADPDKFESFEPGLFWAREFGKPFSAGRLCIPMDSRTTAGPTGSRDYAFYRSGGWSWITPYLAGVYALACQVKPEITPDEFLSLAMKTGRTIQFTQNGKTLPLGPIIDPVAIIDALQEGMKKTSPANPQPQ